MSLKSFVGSKPDGKLTIETESLSVNKVVLMFWAFIVKLKSWTVVLNDIDGCSNTRYTRISLPAAIDKKSTMPPLTYTSKPGRE